MQVGTVVKVADNSGVSLLRIIKILKKNPRSIGKLGDFVIGSALRVHNRKKFKVNKGSICRALVIRQAEYHTRKDGIKMRFQWPAVCIVTKKGLPRSTKIYGPVPKELREKGFIRIVSLSTIAL